MPFPANHDAAVVMEPGEQPFDLPAASISAQRSAVLRESFAAPRMVRRDHLDAILLAQARIEPIAVVGTIADQPFGQWLDESLLESDFDELGLMRRSAGHVQGERKTMAVADRHDFAALTASSRAHGGAPFFAELKLASMNASLRSIFPRSRKSSASFCNRRSSNPERCHCWKRR